MGIVDALESAGLGTTLITLIISMLPVVELRGAVPFGLLRGLPVHICLLVSILGNLLPTPFIILFIRRIFAWMRGRSRRLHRLVERLENRAAEKGAKLYRGEIIGLIIFVAIPLPGTGAWTGALIAALLNIRMRVAIPALALGVLIAGILVTGITVGFTVLF